MPPHEMPMAPIGVYVHFPFCLRKCPYCDFVSHARARSQLDHQGYAGAVLAELARRRDALQGRRLTSVFLGGGTPSLWEPAALGRVLRALLDASDERAHDVEVTVECNPSSLDEARARALLDVGVNRLSVGVQSFDDARLRSLGRLHDSADALAAVEAALRGGVPRVSADIIYGVDPHPAGAADALRAADAGVEHVSAYSLTVEPGTGFGELARRGGLHVAGEDDVTEDYFAIEAALGARGFVHYEISNYARPGHEARHNLGYWRGDDYLGLGCAAFGTLSTPDGVAIRYRNHVDPARYVEAAVSGSDLDAEQESIDAQTRLRERLMLGLRLLEGVDLEAAAAELGVPAWTPERRRAAERLAAQGRLELDGGRIRVPSRARIWTDAAARDLF